MNNGNSANQSETKNSVFSFDALGFQLFLVLREIQVCGQIFVNTTSEPRFVAIFVNKNSVKYQEARRSPIFPLDMMIDFIHKLAITSFKSSTS